MAVFTSVSKAMLADYLVDYTIGESVCLSPIAEGVENTNYKLETTTGHYILTLFERRTPSDALPYVVGLMRHLNRRGLPVPAPVADRTGRYLKMLAGRPSLIVTFLSGRSLSDTDAHACHAMGGALARLHLAASDYTGFRPNPFGFKSWETLVQACADKATGEDRTLLTEVGEALSFLRPLWPFHLPKGACHTDLFPDNVFFEGGVLSGLIDFYFSCDEIRAYDLAVCLSSWCFDRQNRFVPERVLRMIDGYGAVRPLSVKERDALPLLCLGASVRFTLTRLYDRLYPQDGAMVTEKDPKEYAARLRLFFEMASSGKGMA